MITCLSSHRSETSVCARDRPLQNVSTRWVFLTGRKEGYLGYDRGGYRHRHRIRPYCMSLPANSHRKKKYYSAKYRCRYRKLCRALFSREERQIRRGKEVRRSFESFGFSAVDSKVSSREVEVWEGK